LRSILLVYISRHTVCIDVASVERLTEVNRLQRLPVVIPLPAWTSRTRVAPRLGLSTSAVS